MPVCARGGKRRPVKCTFAQLPYCLYCVPFENVRLLLIGPTVVHVFKAIAFKAIAFKAIAFKAIPFKAIPFKAIAFKAIAF